jgi:hypothetical protein
MLIKTLLLLFLLQPIAAHLICSSRADAYNLLYRACLLDTICTHLYPNEIVFFYHLDRLGIVVGNLPVNITHEDGFGLNWQYSLRKKTARIFYAVPLIGNYTDCSILAADQDEFVVAALIPSLAVVTLWRANTYAIGICSDANEVPMLDVSTSRTICACAHGKQCGHDGTYSLILMSFVIAFTFVVIALFIYNIVITTKSIVLRE